MISSRLFSPIGRFVGAALLVLSLLVCSVGAAAMPLDRAAAVTEGRSPQGLVVGFWVAILELFANESGIDPLPADGFQAKCGVIPDPSGLCPKQGSPIPVPVRAEDVPRGPAES